MGSWEETDSGEVTEDEDEVKCLELYFCLMFLSHYVYSGKFLEKKLDLIHQCFLRVRKIATPGKTEDMMMACCNVRLNDQYFL